jgi:pimeloyl-ACP methyl ester carboxylesterase
MHRVSFKIFFLFTILFTSSFCIAAEDSFDDHVERIENLSLVTYYAENPKGVILWVHGGPFENPIGEGLKTRTDFFKGLVKEGYTVIAPSIPQSISGDRNKEYKKILNDTAKWISQHFPNQKITLLAHSLGGHWTGQTLRDQDSSLRKLSYRWVILSGTTHHGAGDIKRYMKNPESFLKEIVDSAGLVTWDNNDPLFYSDTNFRLCQNLFGYSQYLHWLNFTVGPNSVMEKRYQIGCDCLYNPIMSGELNESLSVAYHTHGLPDIPTLVIHPVGDMAVTVDTSYFFVKKCLENKRDNVYFSVSLKGTHNWMTNISKSSAPESYSENFKKIISFLNEEDFTPHTQESLIFVEKYLDANPALNYVKAHSDFLKNNSVSFYSFPNELGLELNLNELKHYPSIELIHLDGLDKTVENIKKLLWVKENSFPENFVTQENLNLAKVKLDESSDETQQYYYDTIEYALTEKLKRSTA